MKINPLKIIVLFDYPMDPPEKNHGDHIVSADWRPNKNVIDALQRLGHDVLPVGIYNQIRPLVAKIKRFQPDLVFNLVECFNNDRKYDSSVAGLLDLLNIPYTGCDSFSLTLCRNKFITKRMLGPLKVKLPKSVIFPMNDLTRSLRNLKYPLFVKPIGHEGSEGIVQNSFCENQNSCLERVKFVHDKLNTDALVEEFIEGREIYVSILGNNKLKVLPLRELKFTEFPDDKPKFATFKAKWDKEFRKKWGIKFVFADDIEETLFKRISRISRKVYRSLGLTGYGRLDLRLANNNDIYVIEVNPNPSLSNDDEVALSAKRIDIPYDQLIQKIVDFGVKKSK